MSKLTLKQLITVRKRVNERIEDLLEELSKGATKVEYHLSTGRTTLVRDITTEEFLDTEEDYVEALGHKQEVETLITKLNLTEITIMLNHEEQTLSISSAIEVLKRQREYINIYRNLKDISQEPEVSQDYNSTNTKVTTSNLSTDYIEDTIDYLTKEVTTASEEVDYLTGTLTAELSFADVYIHV